MRILAALVARSETGRGRYLDVAAAQGVLDMMAFTIDEYLSSGPDLEIPSDLITGRYACYDLYQASDGGWIAVAAIEGKFFANLCAALGLDDWIERQYDAEAQGGLRRRWLAACFSERPRDDWIDALAPRGTCVAPVLGVDEIARDPHWAARGVIDTYVHPTRGLQRQVHCLGDNGRGEPPPLDDDSSRRPHSAASGSPIRRSNECSARARWDDGGGRPQFPWRAAARRRPRRRPQ